MTSKGGKGKEKAKETQNLDKINSNLVYLRTGLFLTEEVVDPKKASRVPLLMGG